MHPSSDDELISATTIPLPIETDDDEDNSSFNASTFAKQHECFPPGSPGRRVSATDLTPMPSPVAPLVPQHIVEDQLRARAAQAESAADRLLELVEPEDDHTVSPIPAILLPSTRPIALAKVPPATPLNRPNVMHRQVVLLQDSPVYNGAAPPVIDILEDSKRETGWWLTRMSGAPRTLALR